MIKVDFCKGDRCSYLHELFTNMGVIGLIVGKDFQCQHIVFLFVAPVIYRATEFSRNASMNFVRKKCSELLLKVIKD